MTHFKQSTHTIEALADSLMAFALIVTATIWAHQNKMPLDDIRRFLHFRLTLLNASFSIVFAVLWRRCFSILRLFQPPGGFLRSSVLSVVGCSVMTAIVALYLVARQAEGPVGRILRYFFVVSLAYQLMCWLCVSLFSAGHEPENVIILGSGRRASMAWRELRIEHHRSKRLLGFVDDRSSSLMAPDIAERFLGRVDDLPQYLLRNVVDELVIAAPLRSGYAMVQRAITIAETSGMRVVSLSDIFTMTHGKVLRRRAHPFVELLPKDEQHLLAQRFKRCLDMAGAFFGLLVLSPVLLVVALAIKATSKGPIFFSQVRYGYRRRRFRIWKFRSMVHNAPDLMDSLEERNEAVGPIFKIKNDPRITTLGALLRRSSIDELPQLWNVLRGDMSLVGPRPMSVRDVSLFDEISLMRRFSVRPGMTGSWQVAGRSSLSFEQWMTLDFNYIDDWSFGLDLKILARTVPAVLRRTGAA